jgi:protoheme IX farnesyltransferase
VSAEDLAAAGTAPGVARRLLDVLALTKPRLNALTVFAVAAGWTAAVGKSGDPHVFAATVLGSALVAGGSSALNQYVERDRDALMARTADRPLPAGRLSPRDGLVAGVAMSVAGLAALALATNALTVALAFVCLAWYVAVYTPLKTRTSLNTIAGTISGALPPVMGVAAATGRFTFEAWFLFSLMVAWQLPHFLSIAWLYRGDYERGGYVMLPSVPDGEAQTARQVVVQSLLTMFVSLAAVPFHLAGRTYLLVAFGAGIVLVGAGVAFALARTDDAARRLLRVSILHLPVVLTAFALDRV